MVIAGRERGKTGKVIRVLPERHRATVERLNIVKRHTKARGPQTPYGVVEKEAPIHLSNLMVMCDKCNAPVRMGKLRLEDGRSVRVCRRCKEQIDR
jgi:large subunit ribosomal protein L24